MNSTCYISNCLRLHPVKNEDILNLSSEQIEILSMSEEDMKNGNLISESELGKLDSKWLH